MDDKAMRELQRRAAKARATSMRRHVLVCTDDDCDDERKRAKQMRKDVAGRQLRAEVTVTEVGCLGICKQGPICVVYPEGTWYGRVRKKAAARIVDEHLAQGQVVEEHAFLVNDLR